MIAKNPEELSEDLKDCLKEYFIISKETGPIRKNKDLNDRTTIHAFYGSLFVAEQEITEFENPLETYSDLSKRLEIGKSSVKKAHQVLRDRGLLKKDKKQNLNHRITDGGIQKLLEDLKDE